MIRNSKLVCMVGITYLYTSHIKLSTVYMYPHISSWRHSEKRADSNKLALIKPKEGA